MTMQQMPWVIGLLMVLVLLAMGGAYLTVRIVTRHADRFDPAGPVGEPRIKP